MILDALLLLAVGGTTWAVSCLVDHAYRRNLDEPVAETAPPRPALQLHHPAHGRAPLDSLQVTRRGWS